MNPRTFVLTVNRRIACFDKTAAHLDAMGIKWERFDGIDNQICRLTPVDTFDLDRAGEKIAPKHICAQLSHYMLWKVMLYLPQDIFWVLEYDAVMVPDWQVQYDRAMSVMPADFDLCFLGSCCYRHLPKRHIGQNLYEVRHPLCGHGICYRKKALPVLLNAHQKFFAPLDIAMAQDSLPKLRVYTILDPIVNQLNTPLK